MIEEDVDQIIMVQRAVFGKQVESFLGSEIGRYILTRASEQKAEAQAEFLEVDPQDTAKVRAIQNKILLANDIARWLADAVSDGLRALSIIEDRS